MVPPHDRADLAGGTALVTTQLALPEDTCVEVYSTPGYGPSVRNLAATPPAADPVVGTATDGLTATLFGSVEIDLMVVRATIGQP